MRRAGSGFLRSPNLPIAALLAAALVWGLTFSLVKTALTDAGALSFLGLRFAVALGAFSLFAARPAFRPAFGGLCLRDWWLAAAAGASLYGGFLFQTLGLRTATAANSAFITGLCVVMVPFLLWAGGEPPRRRHAAGALVAAAGLYWLTGAGPAGAGRGDLLTLVCAVLFALHIVLLGRGGMRMDSLTFFLVQLMTAAALAMAAGLVWGGPVRWSARLTVALAVTGVLATAGAFFLQTWAQRRLEPARAALWILTEPLFALGFGALLLGEFPGPSGLAGAALILAGVAVAEAGESLAPGIFSTD